MCLRDKQDAGATLDAELTLGVNTRRHWGRPQGSLEALLESACPDFLCSYLSAKPPIPLQRVFPSLHEKKEQSPKTDPPPAGRALQTGAFHSLSPFSLSFYPISALRLRPPSPHPRLSSSRIPVR